MDKKAPEPKLGTIYENQRLPESTRRGFLYARWLYATKRPFLTVIDACRKASDTEEEAQEMAKRAYTQHNRDNWEEYREVWSAHVDRAWERLYRDKIAARVAYNERRKRMQEALQEKLETEISWRATTDVLEDQNRLENAAGKNDQNFLILFEKPTERKSVDDSNSPATLDEKIERLEVLLAAIRQRKAEQGSGE